MVGQANSSSYAAVVHAGRRRLGRYPAAEKLLDVRVRRDAQGRATGLEIVERGERSAWAEHAHGAIC